MKNRPVHILQSASPPKTPETNAAPHAEMQLLKIRDGTSGFVTSKTDKRKSVLAASKPACENCHKELSHKQIPHNSEGGLKANRIKNWEKPEAISTLATTTFGRVNVSPSATNF